MDTALERQIARELCDFVDPMIDVVGDEALAKVVKESYEQSIQLAAQLSGPDRAAADQAAETLGFLANYRDGEVSWWRRPLGMLLAAHGPGNVELRPWVVMTLLDVNRQRIYQLLKAHRLRQGEGGGITAQSVVWRFTKQRVGVVGDDEPDRLIPGDISDQAIEMVRRYYLLPSLADRSPAA